jgi:multidrug efflux pump subunit AcrA (membrane-fusion protein)
MTKVSTAAAKPTTVEIVEVSEVAFANAAALIRDGSYIFSRSRPPAMFPHSGQTSIVLELGNPDADATVRAQTALALALAREQAQTQRDELAALAQTRAEQERTGKAAQLAAELVAAKALVKSLEKAARTA